MSKGIGVFIALGLVMASASAQPVQVIKEVLVRGNSNITTEAIKASMRSAEGRPLSVADLDRDQTALLQLGVFKDVKISTRQLTDTEVQVVVDVEEFPVVKEISVEGNTVIPAADILKAVAQPVGQVMNLNYRKTTNENIKRLYEDKGYFVEVDFPTTEASPNTMVVKVIETTVNSIKIEGLRHTSKRVMDLLIRTEPNKPLNLNTWVEDYRRLRSTQWFSDVTADPPEFTDDPGRVDLTIRVKEQRTALFDVGVALDPQSRLAGTFRIRDTNFRGNGQQIGFNYQQDTFGSGASIGFDYSDPYMDSKNTALQLSLYSKVNSYFTSFGGGSQLSNDDRFDERRNGGSLILSRTYRDRDSFATGITFDDVRTVNKSTTSTDFIQQDGTQMKFLLQASRDTRDVPLDPFSGMFARLSVEPGFTNIHTIGGQVAGFTDILGSNSYVRTSLDIKAFFSRTPNTKDLTREERLKRLSAPRPVIATRARIGNINGTVPFFEQLFVGGADSLRGYNEQRFWGKNAAMATVELRYPIQDNFSLVPFIDAGGAWGGYPAIQGYTQSSKPNFHVGYGAGLAFRVPSIGSIRIDFGFTPEGKSRTHFTIGGTF